MNNEEQAGRIVESLLVGANAIDPGEMYYGMVDNKALITPEMKAAVDKATDDIKSGKVQVHDYMADKSCPAS